MTIEARLRTFPFVIDLTRMLFSKRYWVLSAGLATATLFTHCHTAPTAPTSSTLEAKHAFHPLAVASYQSLGAGIMYPYAALKIVAPEGAGPLGKSSLPLGTQSFSLALLAKSLSTTDVQSGIKALPALGLYESDATYAGDVATLSFFTDANGATPAGTVTMTLPLGADGSTKYGTYPVQVKIAVNITGGNLPSTGNLTFTFAGASGANTMVGTLTIKSSIKLDLDLSLSDSMEVGGAVTITENGATTTCDHMNGKITETLHCSAKVSPYGWDGTGTFNLLTGQMTINLHTEAGADSASIDGPGRLILTYGDSSTQTVSDPFTAPLVPANDAHDKGNGHDSGSSDYSEAYFSKLYQINNAGAILGFYDLANSGVYQAYSSTGFRDWLSQGRPNAMNNSGVIVGDDYFSPAHPVLWMGPGKAPSMITYLAISETLSISGYDSGGAVGVGITDNGVIVGYSSSTSSGVGQGLYWTDASATPTPIIGLDKDPNPSGDVPVMAIAPDGKLVAYHYSGGDQYQYWSSPSAQPAVLAGPEGGGSVTSFHINTVGQIVANIGAQAYYWSSPTAQPSALPAIDGGISVFAGGINASGLVVGAVGVATDGQHAVYWKNGQAVDMNSLLPPGKPYYLYEADGVNDSRQVVCRPGGITGQTATFCSVPSAMPPYCELSKAVILTVP